MSRCPYCGTLKTPTVHNITFGEEATHGTYAAECKQCLAWGGSHRDKIIAGIYPQALAQIVAKRRIQFAVLYEDTITFVKWGKLSTYPLSRKRRKRLKSLFGVEWINGMDVIVNPYNTI